jgi:hypothetical protein
LIKQQLHKLVHLSLSEHFPVRGRLACQAERACILCPQSTLGDGRRPGPSTTAVWCGHLVTFSITGGSSNLTESKNHRFLFFVRFPHPPWVCGHMPMLRTGGYRCLIQSLQMIKGAFTLGVRDSSSVESPNTKAYTYVP